MTEASKNGIFAFDHFKLDVGKLMLYRDGEEILIPAKVAKTLAVLVENAGSILSYNELIDRVWEDSIVEDSNLTHYIYVLRKTLGTMPDGRPYIETLRRRGYRFHGAVRVEDPTPVPLAQFTNPPAAMPPVIHGIEREGNVLRVVEWTPLKIEDEEPKRVAEVSVRRSFPSTVITAIAIVALGLTVVGFRYVWPKSYGSSTTGEPRGEVSITHVTTGRHPLGATVSADGNYFTYHETDGDVAKMFIQQVGQTSRIEIESTSEKAFFEKTFTPDGQFIYYAASSIRNGERDIYRIPTMGGSSIKLIDDVSSGVSFSPSGREMVFLRGNFEAKSTQLVIADRDGGNQRVVLERREPTSIVENAAWSPDGNFIVCAITAPSASGKPGPQLIHILNVATGEIERLSDERWDYIHRAMWLADQSGIVLIATREKESYSTKRDQVYYLSYPEGLSRRLTTDGNRHEPDSLGVSRDGSVLSVSGNRSSQIYSIDGDGESSNAQEITRGLADGRAGLAPLPDGRIGFLSRNADEINLIVANADGTGARQLPTGFPVSEELHADPRGRFFVFSTPLNGNNHLVRVSTDGSSVQQLTAGESTEIDSAISPDGEWIAYDSATFENGAEKSSLLRKPAGGGEAVNLTTDCKSPTYSPDGSMISCVNTKTPQVEIISAVDGGKIESHPLPAFATLNLGIGWTRDGTGLVYFAAENGVSNLWVLSRDRSKARKLTNFTSGAISRYAFATDYSRIFVARGYPIQDVIMIRNYR